MVENTNSLLEIPGVCLKLKLISTLKYMVSHKLLPVLEHVSVLNGDQMATTLIQNRNQSLIQSQIRDLTQNHNLILKVMKVVRMMGQFQTEMKMMKETWNKDIIVSFLKIESRMGQTALRKTKKLTSFTKTKISRYKTQSGGTINHMLVALDFLSTREMSIGKE